jgi:hypothetical protein
MSKFTHTVFIALLTAIVFITLVFLLNRGFSYYILSQEDRVYHDSHQMLKPSGIMGHGLGIFGSLLIIIGVVSYMARKRYRWMSRMGLLKHWLEFHIFLCTLGPIMILFHTSFKFGGIVAVSFWSMVAVFLSGIAGRFIYLQIPRSKEGRELSLNEVREMKTDVAGYVRNSFGIDENSAAIIADAVKKKPGLYYKNPIVRFVRKRYFEEREAVRDVKKVLKAQNLPKNETRKVISLVKDEINLNRKIERLDMMQNLFKYWHVAHLPFALVMLIIMVIHVGVTIVFGYRWIF